MGNANSRSTTYHQYYEALQKSNPGAIQQLDLQGLDPYKVMGVSKNFTFDELKEAYRRVARMVHPDKGGTDQLFQAVTDCFRQLAYEYKMRTSDRPHHELKKEYESYKGSQGPGAGGRGPPRPTMAADDSFLDRFNRMFEDNRLEVDESQSGYGHLMAASSKKREDIEVPKILKRFNEDAFHKTFETVTLAPSHEVVVYKEPEALPLAKKIQYTELGSDSTGDFSSGPSTAAAEKRALQYTDYMKAHTTTRLVDPRAVQARAQYRSVDDYESARAAATKKPATQEELRWRAEKQREEEAAEEKRLARLKERDHAIALHHDKVNRLMLNR